MSESRVSEALGAYVERFLTACEAENGHLPEAEHDPEWPSPCEQGAPDFHGFVRWRPVPQAEPLDWSGLETALEAEVHPDLKAYFGHFWSGNVPARHREGGLLLIQLWNRDDFDRLVENELGHVLAQRRARLPLTLFFACTDDPELLLSIDNRSGAVLLERPGRPPLREVAPSLAQFLEELAPETAV